MQFILQLIWASSRSNRRCWIVGTDGAILCRLLHSVYHEHCYLTNGKLHVQYLDLCTSSAYGLACFGLMLLRSLHVSVRTGREAGALLSAFREEAHSHGKDPLPSHKPLLSLQTLRMLPAVPVGTPHGETVDISLNRDTAVRWRDRYKSVGSI